MSETNAGGHVVEPVDDQSVSEDDLRKMLDDARSERRQLQEQLESERRQRQTVERDRDTYAGRVVSEAEQRYTAELNAVSTALSSASESLASAKAAFKAALSEGDHDRAAELQEQIARAVSRREQAEGRKAWLEGNKEQVVRASQPAPRQDDDYGGYNLIPEEKAWVANRPQFRTDENYRSRVAAASNLAVAERLARGSEGYFRRIEQIIGEGTRAEPDHDEPAPRRPSADVSPNRRTQPGADRRVRVELNAFEREIADGLYGNPGSDSYIADAAQRYEHYHTNREKMKAAGRL